MSEKTDCKAKSNIIKHANQMHRFLEIVSECNYCILMKNKRKEIHVLCEECSQLYRIMKEIQEEENKNK